MNNAPEVSVVLPYLNEAMTVGHCVEQTLKALAASGLRGEVIVVAFFLSLMRIQTRND
jgi:glycosyltransferase involved in cell wall biosynthesis